MHYLISKPQSSLQVAIILIKRKWIDPPPLLVLFGSIIGEWSNSWSFRVFPPKMKNTSERISMKACMKSSSKSFTSHVADWMCWRRPPLYKVSERMHVYFSATDGERERGCVIILQGNITQKHIVVSSIVMKVKKQACILKSSAAFWWMLVSLWISVHIDWQKRWKAVWHNYFWKALVIPHDLKTILNACHLHSLPWDPGDSWK